MPVESENKPCLVKTARGFSVNYKNHFLYSKYNPERNILSIIEKMQILPGTIILCFSPVLKYGLEALAKKLPENCLMLGIEADFELHKLAEEESKALECRKNNVYTLIPQEELFTLPQKLEKSGKNGKFRRVIYIEFSGGFYLNQEFYIRLFEACRNSVSQFWKNHVTLVKFGRKYCANIFRNLNLIPKSIERIITSKKIVVVGAGESSVETLKKIGGHRDDFFILAVDAALKTLKALKIKADAAVCEEAQSIIARAFTGCCNNFDYLFVSTTATNTVARINPKKNIFYTPLFTDTGFLRKLEKYGILSSVQEPLGSVGLTATKIALSIRKDENVPVFVTGLDFSYSTGKTHATNSFHDNARRTLSTKIKSFENFSASFGNDSIKICGKDGKTVITTTALSGYAKLFIYKFAGTKNLFDAGKTGIKLGLPQKQPDENTENSTQIKKLTEEFLYAEKDKEISTKIKNWLKTEKEALNELKSIFTGKIQLSEKEQNERILELLMNREYLFIHFPDSYKLDFSQSFLNRIRIEIDYFLKIIAHQIL